MRPPPESLPVTELPGRHPLAVPDAGGPRPGDVDELLVAAGHGDLEAFAAFYDRTAPAVFGLLSGVLDRPAEAEWAAEVVYLQLWRTAAGFDPADRSAWSTVLFTARRVLTGPVGDRVAAGSGPSAPRRGRR